MFRTHVRNPEVKPREWASLGGQRKFVASARGGARRGGGDGHRLVSPFGLANSRSRLDVSIEGRLKSRPSADSPSVVRPSEGQVLACPITSRGTTQAGQLAGDRDPHGEIEPESYGGKPQGVVCSEGATRQRVSPDTICKIRGVHKRRSPTLHRMVGASNWGFACSSSRCGRL